MNTEQETCNGGQPSVESGTETESLAEERPPPAANDSADPLHADLEILLVGPAGTGGIGQYIAQQADRLPMSTTVHKTRTPSDGSGMVWFVRGLLLALVAMGRFVGRDRPDIVHVHTSHQYSFYRASFYVLYSRYLWRRPAVLHVHGSSFDEFVDNPRLVVALLQRAAPSKIAVVSNAIDPTEYEASVASDVPEVVFVSNLVKRKGVNELISALKEFLESTDQGVTVTIAGDGPLADEVTALADSHDEVTYLGYISEAEKRSVLSSGSIFVLPTHAEGLPIAMLEGMAGGNAIISTTVGAIPEVIDEDMGVLTTPGDVSALRNTIAELVSSPERCREMGQHNRHIVESEYSWEAAISDISCIYRTISASS